MQYPKIIFAISLLFFSIVFFSRCLNNSSLSHHDPRGGEFAGSQACLNCHKETYNSYVHQNHFKTSSKVDFSQLKKLIAPAKDTFNFNASSYIQIEGKDSLLYQSWFINNKMNASEKFDIAFGSGEKAQTYAYWKDDKLFQLPLTYYSKLNTWANSPGFSIQYANFTRVIKSRCFECHSSYVSKEFVQSGSLSVEEKLDKGSIIYGIDCERCHGPAAEHVKFQQENPSIKTAGHIVSIKLLSRKRQLDVCATCHSGNDQETQKSLFAFFPGDTLSNFYFPSFGSEINEPDVHGKQMQMLQASKCFVNTDMTCTSCHNTHNSENNPAMFISKCMDCHQNSDHALRNLKEYELPKENNNIVRLSCIDCHMPLQASKTISFNGAEAKNIPYFIRTHKIAVYNQKQ